MESTVFERITRWIELAFAPTFQMLRHVPPSAMIRLLTPF
jgi:ABC-type nitrate/sulfonate/bicarbonate transport system permease component